jgi:KDO2-lipid IV(A) lauroyltransferase
VGSDHQQRRAAPFGRGPRAARVLGRVIDGAAWAGARLPVRAAVAAAWVGGHLEWALRPGKRQRLAVNLAHAVGAAAADRAVRRLVRQEFVNEARRSADLLWAVGAPDELLRTIEVVGTSHVDSALRRGNGVLLAGVHVGGWEIAAAAATAIVPVPTSVIVADNWLAWAMEHVRVRAGLGVISHSQPAPAALEVLQRGEALVVLGDDGTRGTPRRVPVRFCDGVAALPAAPAVLARLAQAPLVTFAVLPVAPRRWRVVLDPPIYPGPRQDALTDVVTLQALADRYSAIIRNQPEWWAASFDVAWVPPE